MATLHIFAATGPRVDKYMPVRRSSLATAAWLKCGSAESWVCVIDRVKRSSLIGRVMSDTALKKGGV